MNVTLVDRLPTPEEYRALCTAVGWGEVIDFAAAPASLAGSLFGVVALEEGRTIGMGRLVGDGAIYFYVQDVAVDPAHQGRGVGTAILARLVDHATAAATNEAFVGLFAAAGSERLYRAHGFERHDGMTGMFRVVGRGLAAARAEALSAGEAPADG
jgi:GNAT superfamily N-acetyltransferase